MCPHCGVALVRGLDESVPALATTQLVALSLDRASGRGHHRGPAGRAREHDTRRADRGAGSGQAGHPCERRQLGAQVSPAPHSDAWGRAGAWNPSGPSAMERPLVFGCGDSYTSGFAALTASWPQLRVSCTPQCRAAVTAIPCRAFRPSEPNAVPLSHFRPVPTSRSPVLPVSGALTLCAASLAEHHILRLRPVAAGTE